MIEMINKLIISVLLADAPISDPSPLQTPSNIHSDPLIDKGGQVTIYIGTALFALGIVAVVGFFSRRVEHAIIAALALSLCLVAFFVFTR